MVGGHLNMSMMIYLIKPWHRGLLYISCLHKERALVTAMNRDVQSWFSFMVTRSKVSYTWSVCCSRHQSARNTPSLWAGTIFPVNLGRPLTQQVCSFINGLQGKHGLLLDNITSLRAGAQDLLVPEYQNILWLPSHVTQYKHSPLHSLKYTQAGLLWNATTAGHVWTQHRVNKLCELCKNAKK